jgi:hypothetical protein
MGITSEIAGEFASLEAQRRVRRLEDQIKALERQVGRLALASVAMQEILRDHLGISAEVIEAKIFQIDLRDGKVDGTFHQPPKMCADCGRLSGAAHATCVYCGKPLPQESSPIG